MSKPTFVIGDVHGHFDRLAALLQAAGILGDCTACGGTGNISPGMAFTPAESMVGGPHFSFESEDTPCPTCDGDAIVRVNHDATVIQLGDLGHFGGSTGSPTGDHMCYEYADRWLDLILWGNHDRAVIDNNHVFGGFSAPQAATKHLMSSLRNRGKIKLAAQAHGYLLVHAGISRSWTSLVSRYDAAGFATWLNEGDESRLATRYPARIPIMDDVGRARGGRLNPPEGGVLWADWNREKHLEGKPFKYICGHTRQEEPNRDEYGNWNIDVGGVSNGRLAGLWLDDGRVAEKVEIDISRKGLTE